jgi:Mce-associated membrane protein
MIVVAVLAVGGERALAWQDERDRAGDEKDAAAAATAEVVGLIDISGSTSEEDVAKLLDGATAGFRSELEAQADRLRRALSKHEVSATGEVVSTGLVKLEDGRATVIVAAVGTVENKQTAEAEPRNYRLRVDLQQADDRWLVSGLEFVA